MTINDIREKKFEVVKRGYNPEEVDGFLREVGTTVDSLYNNKTDLLKKMEILASKVEDYRKDEDSIQEALLGAQKLGKSVVTTANEKAQQLTKESEERSEQMVVMARADADKLINDAKVVAQELLVKAKAESKRMVADAQQNVDTVIRNTKYDIEKEQNNLVRMQREVSSFKANLLEVYRSHIDLIKNLPEIEIEENNQKIREAHDLEKKIYDQKQNKSTEESLGKTEVFNTASANNAQAENSATAQFDSVPNAAQEAPMSQEGRELTDDEKKIVDRAKREVLQDTVEIAKEHYVKKFSDLKFGGNK